MVLCGSTWVVVSGVTSASPFVFSDAILLTCGIQWSIVLPAMKVRGFIDSR
jgi:uncharacterized protein (DUF697 family)